jgi:hypothetical protein
MPRASPSVLNVIACCAITALFASGSCGSSSETITTPSQPRCEVQAQAEHLAFAADGGASTVRISTNRECTWSVRSDAAWVSLTPPITGQGDGSVQFTVAANADPAARAAAMNVGEERLQVSQEGRRCEFQLSSTGESVDPAGGERTIQVSTSSPQCQWTAVSGVPWITIVSARENSGSGVVTLRVDPAGGPPRTGAIVIAGQTVQVEQGTGCSYAIGTAAFSLGSAGGARDVPVTAPAGCAWTAASDAPWITLASGGTGTGPGVVSFRVAATDGPARTGTLTVAGRVVTVTQSPGCGYTVEPASYAAPLAGGATTIAVRTGPGCPWTATSSSDWISIASGQSGSGPGEVRVSVAANTTQGRTGSVRIADQTVSVTQASGCALGVNPSSVSVGATAGTGTVQVSGNQGCAWSATSADDWITVTAGQSGNGPGEVRFSVAANPAAARTGSLKIAEQTVTVTQATGCTFGVSPPSVSVGSPAGNGTIQVASAPGCAWSASSGAPWLTIAAGASGSGNGQVQFAAAVNSGPARDGSLSIAGHTVPVTQASGCTYSVTPATQDIAGAGGGGAASITTAASCPWTASSSTDWIAVAAPSGAGPGQVPFTVPPNQAPPRTGTLTVAGQNLTINQASTCTWVMVPPSHSFGASGGNGNILVLVSGPCTWTAVSDVDWLTVTAGGSGTGNGLVQFIAAPNNGAARTGSLTIAGQRYEVTEAGH